MSPDGILVDLMVPEALAGPGSRGARLTPHGKKTARRATVLEGALIDRKPMEVTSLDPRVERSVAMLVAGPAALLVAKVHKIAERSETRDRASNKDALDVLRLLQAIDTPPVAAGLAQLADHELSAAVTTEALSQLAPLFGTPEAIGTGRRRAWHNHLRATIELSSAGIRTSTLPVTATSNRSPVPTSVFV